MSLLAENFIEESVGFVNVKEKIFEKNIIFISGYVTCEMATDIIANLLFKNMERAEEIKIFISSQGGDIRGILAIYDIMSMMPYKISTIGLGIVDNESVLLLAAGTPGCRLMSKNSFLCAAPLKHNYSAFSDLSEAQIDMSLFEADEKKFITEMAFLLEKKKDEVKDLFSKKKFLTPALAKKNNFIDEVV